MITEQEVEDEIGRQLDWRSPTGNTMGHVVLTREQAHIVYAALQRSRLGGTAATLRLVEFRRGEE